MNLLKLSVLPFAAILLLSGNSVFGQTNMSGVPQDLNSKQLQLFSQNVSTYTNEETYALPAAAIPDRDILWRKRVWRDIDTRDADNKIFANDRAKPANTYLANILTNAAIGGKIKAYDAENDRLTKVLTRDELIALITPGKDKNATGFNPNQVIKYRIKEDWLFLKSENKLVVRIIGLAPVLEIKNTDGTITDKELFWIFYFGERNYMARQKVYNENMNWDEVFINRKFTSKIIKVSDYGQLAKNK